MEKAYSIMCGINGIVDFKKNLNQNEIRNIINNFNKSISHRGPDDNGCEILDNIGLGHTRLSIIDLSKNGKQPMYDKKNNTFISFNGEIYNFLDLKYQHLKNNIFYSNTDTEVILNLYSSIGIEKLIKEINGMYAFCILDKNRKKIFLSRDKIGKKPLYYYYNDEYLIWSSELRSFIHSPIKNQLKINDEAVRNYFDVGYIPAPLSIFNNVIKLLPGETIEINLSSNTKKNYFFETKNENYNCNLENINNFEKTLEDAVKIRTISDVPYGVFLSSGVDSTLVASILAKSKSKKINSFSIGLNNNNLDESKLSKKIAQNLGLDHNELIINETDLINTIPKMVDTYGEPFADSSQIPTYILSEFSKKKITVALSGDGGDEIFGGYNRYLYFKKYGYLLRLIFALNKINILNNSIFKSVTEKIKKNFPIKESIYKFDSLSQIKNIQEYYKKMVMQSNEVNQIYKNDVKYNIFYLKGDEDEDWIKMMQIKDINNYLPDDILTKVDRASMAHSLEVRCPLLDKRLHKFVGMSDNYKISNNHGKFLLRQILSKYIDPSLISKKKMGFAIPLHKWLSGELYDIGSDLLNSTLLKHDSILNQSEILKIWEINKKGNPHFTFLLWSIIIYLQWKESWQKLV